VIIEKPIALSVADADEIIRESRRTGVKVCVSHQNRFNRSVQYIRKALEEGRFGKMLHGSVHVLWNRSQEYYNEAPWRGTYAHDGGCLMNQGIHSIDLLLWMLGDPVEVTAYTDNLMHPYMEAEDFGAAMVKFSSGAYGLIEVTVNTFPANLEETLYLFGETGSIKAGGKSENRIEVWNFADGHDDPEEVIKACYEDPPNVYGFGHTPLYADMIDAIEDDRKPFVDAEEGSKALELVLAIYRSAKEHMPVKLPLTDASAGELITGKE
jgi:predicted dehydrogenase